MVYGLKAVDRFTNILSPFSRKEKRGFLDFIKSLDERYSIRLVYTEKFFSGAPDWKILKEMKCKDLKDEKMNIQILSNSHNPKGKFVKVSNKFISQHKGKFEARETDKIHDRAIFIDDRDGWVMGQSIKHGGKKPTYLIKLQKPKELEGIYSKIFLSSKKIK